MGMLAAFAIGMSVQGAVFASPATQSNTGKTTTTVPNEKANIAQLKSIFMTHFTARLGVTSAQLDAALLGAVNDTATQAVKDGLATQEDINGAVKTAQGGFLAFLDQGFSVDKRVDKGNAKIDDSIGFNPKDALFQSAAAALGITQDQLRTELTSGKSFADVASAHGVTVDALKSAILTAVKAACDAAVAANKTTQTESDSIYADFSSHINDIVTMIPNRK